MKTTNVVDDMLHQRRQLGQGCMVLGVAAFTLAGFFAGIVVGIFLSKWL